MLKRDISRWNLLAVSAGGMIGSGWLFSPFISAQLAGPNALVSWMIAAVCMIFIALPFCELGVMFPVSGGLSNYPTYTHGRILGFLFGWIAWLSYVVMTPIEVQAVLQYASHFYPELTQIGTGLSLSLSWTGYGIAFAIMMGLVVLNAYGVKFLSECGKYAGLIKFILPALAMSALLYIAPSMQQANITMSGASDWEAIFSALSTGGIIFAFTGFQNGLVLAGEVSHPQYNLPLSMIGGILIGFMLYFLLQLSFIVAVPASLLTQGWGALSYPGDSGPLVGLLLVVGLGWVATLLMIDAMFSPLGTALVYTAATARIVYGMGLNHHLPAFFLKENRYQVPYRALLINALVGILAFFPFPGWQKLVTFLSSVSILSYIAGPICLLGLRQLKPELTRKFRLPCAALICHIAFYMCNLMLYWCGWDILWKLMVSLLIGLLSMMIYQRSMVILKKEPSLRWFMSYLLTLLCISRYGSLGGGLGYIIFPLDLLIFVPFSLFFLYYSQRALILDEEALGSAEIILGTESD